MIGAQGGAGNLKMSPATAYNHHNREPGYDPRKIFDYWFCRGVQSAIFHYASCTDWKNYKAQKERRKQAEKAAKQRAAEMAVVTEQPRSIPQMQPLPSETNQGWTAEINMGRRYDPRLTPDRRVSSGNTRTRANTADSDRYDYYRAKHPEIDDRSPPVVCTLPPPERAHEVAWMKSPPPSRAVMEGKEIPALNGPPRWPLCIIEQSPGTEELYFEAIGEASDHFANMRKQPYVPEDFQLGELSAHGKKLLENHQLEWDAAQLDAKIPDPAKPKPAWVKPARLPQDADMSSDCDSYDTWLEPEGRYTTRENTSLRSGSPLSFAQEGYDNISVGSITNLPPRYDGQDRRMWATSTSYASAYDSEPDTMNFTDTRNSRFFVHGCRRGPGTPLAPKRRISSLVLVHKNGRSEIRGASYAYEQFWDEEGKKSQQGASK